MANEVFLRPVTPPTAALLVVDVQERLIRVMPEPERLVRRIEQLLRASQILQVPVFVTEQVPEKIGPTVEPLRSLLPGAPHPKSSFSCWGCESLKGALSSCGRSTVIVAGIETHVCVYQTVRDLLARDFRVLVVADAVDSRSSTDRQVALDRMRQAGAEVVTVEMLLFDLLGDATHPKFRTIHALVK